MFFLWVSFGSLIHSSPTGQYVVSCMVSLANLPAEVYLWLVTSALVRVSCNLKFKCLPIHDSTADIAVTAGMLWYLRLRIRGSSVRRM